MGEVAVEGCSADADDFGDGFHGVLTAGVHLLGDGEFVGRQGRWSAADASSGSCGGEAGHGAVADEVAFELGEGTEQMEDELAAGRGGVDVLGERPESDLAIRECGDGFDEVA